MNIIPRDITTEEFNWFMSLQMRTNSDQFFSDLRDLVAAKKLRAMVTNLDVAADIWDGHVYIQFSTRKKLSLNDVCLLTAKAGADDVWMVNDTVCFWWD